MKRTKHLVQWVLVLCLGMSVSGTVSAGSLAGSLEPVTVIVKLEKTARLGRILKQLDGLILDEIPGTDTYLLSLSVLPKKLPGGIAYIERNLGIALPSSPDGTLLQATENATADWYTHQTPFRLVQADEAKKYSNGVGVVVADIDSRFDLAHPALRDRFVPGYDFVDGTGTGRLTQSSTSFMFEDDGLFQSSTSFMFEDDGLFQSSTSFMFEDDGLFQSSTSFMFEDDGLFQSSTSFMFEDDGLFQSSTSFMFEDDGLFQSSTSFMFEDDGLFQSSTSFMFEALDQSSTSFMFAKGPGYSHGTFTAGVIAGIAPNVQIMPLRVFTDEGAADTFALAKAVHYAIEQQVDIINMSWGTSDDSETLRHAIQLAAKRGIVMIAAAGNTNTDSLYYPAAYPEVIGVAATDNQDRKASFSSYGTHIHVSAPGQDIISTMPDGYYGVKSGTSFSAPIVSGQAALLISAGKRRIEQGITRYVESIRRQNPEYSGELGTGRVDLLKSLKKAR